jgi:hypothetical protein
LKFRQSYPRPLFVISFCRRLVELSTMLIPQLQSPKFVSSNIPYKTHHLKEALTRPLITEALGYLKPSPFKHVYDILDPSSLPLTQDQRVQILKQTSLINEQYHQMIKKYHAHDVMIALPNIV